MGRGEEGKRGRGTRSGHDNTERYPPPPISLSHLPPPPFTPGVAIGLQQYSVLHDVDFEIGTGAGPSLSCGEPHLVRGGREVAAGDDGLAKQNDVGIVHLDMSAAGRAGGESVGESAKVFHARCQKA